MSSSSIILPNTKDSSTGSILGQCILQFLVTAENTARLPPPGIARIFFLFGVMVWNAYAIIDTLFPFVDNWTASTDPDSSSLSEAQKAERFSFLLYVVWNTMRSTFLPALPDLAVTKIPIVVTTPPNAFYAAIQSSNLFATYVAQRNNDGYTNANNPNYDYPNKGYYIKVYQDSTGKIPQNLLTDIPSPNTWCPLEVHYIGGAVTKQKPVLPLFDQVLNWFSKDQTTEMLGIATKMYPAQGGNAFILQERDFVNIQSNLSDPEKVYAEVWAGTEPNTTTPPSKTFIIIAAILMSNSSNLGTKECVAMFSGTTFSVFHAGIAAWLVKYYPAFMQPRPIQVLRRDYRSNIITNPVTGSLIQGGFWTPYQQYEPTSPGGSVTPGFPDYVSGHSTFTNAASVFFQLLTGTNNVSVSSQYMIDPVVFLHPFARMFRSVTQPCTWSNIGVPPFSSKTDPECPLSHVNMNWNQWTAIANQAGYSRISGGIHWSQSNFVGLQLGEWVALQMMKSIDWPSLKLDYSSL